ncbi:MAG: hypothetical protein KAT01_05415, partial [Candidatus Aminicenantes bacterium]|nr:hypothetical protein [Candidatus Aminicenantes bacterium]
MSSTRPYSFVLFMGVVCLILAGVNYIGIFALGYTKFLVFVGSGWVALGFVPAIIMKTYQG